MIGEDFGAVLTAAQRGDEAAFARSDQREVAGWRQALPEYRELARRPETPGRRLPRRKARPASLLSTRFAAAAGAAPIAVLGGGVAAAYTGDLPGALQKIARETIAAPGGHDGSATPTTDGNGNEGGNGNGNSDGK